MDVVYPLASDGFIVRRIGSVVEVAVSDPLGPRAKHPEIQGHSDSRPERA